MDTAAFYTDASTHRVNTVIVRLNGNLGTLTGNTGNLLDSNQSVIDFGYFHLEQTLQENGRRTTQDNLRIIVLVVDAGYHGAGGLTLTVEVARNLFGLGQQQFIAFVIEQQHFLFPNLINFCIDNSTYLINVFIINTVFFQFQNFGSQCLAQVQDSTAAKLRKVHFIRHFLSHFIRSVNLPGFAQRNLQVRIFKVFICHNFTITPYFEVTLVRVHNYVVILIGTEHLCNHTAKRLFEYAYHSGSINILQFFKFRKGIYQADSFFFLGHSLI